MSRPSKMRPSGAVREWDGGPGPKVLRGGCSTCGRFLAQGCMALRYWTGSLSLVQSSPAWWMVIHLGVCLRESGMGAGSEPHSARVTSFSGWGTGWVVWAREKEMLEPKKRKARAMNECQG